MGKKGFKYELAYKGVFGRNRSVKFKLVPLTEFCEAPKPLEEVLSLARAALASLGPKGNYHVSVRECPIEVEEYTHGENIHKVEMFEAFSEKVLKAGHFTAGAPEPAL